MKDKIKIVLLGLFMLISVGKGSAYAQILEPGENEVLQCYVEDDYIVPASGGSVEINILDVAKRMYENAGITDYSTYGAKSYCSGEQKMQFKVSYGPDSFNNYAIYKFEANSGITELSNTITIKITSKLLNVGQKSLCAFIVCHFSQLPVRVYNMNVIKGEKVTENTHNGFSYKTTVSYFDEYGRIEQNVNRGASPRGNDIVSFYKYDVMGRKDSVSYMPYVKAETMGEKRADPLAEQRDFYKSQFSSPDDYNYAYSSKKYEKSSLGLVLEAGGAGKIYSVDGGEDRHTTSFRYHKLSGRSIPKYSVSSTSQLVLDGNYPSGTLSVKVVSADMTDTNKSAIEEFYNAQGNLVAKNVSDGGILKMTCYAYDEFGRLRYTIPPIVKDELGITPRIMNPEDYRQYWFYDEYDSRGRLVRSIKPGKEDEYFVYDKKDRLVMSQDGNMRAKKQWVICFYDQWNRVIQKGIYQDMNLNNPHTRAELQALVTNTSFTDVSGFNYEMQLSSSVYDTDENGVLTGPLAFVNIDDVVSSDMVATRNNGRLLYEEIAILPIIEAEGSFGNVKRAYYYDNKGRVVQSVEYDEFTKMTSRVSTKYNFEGQPLIVFEHHIKGIYTDDYKRTDYVYDNYGRLISETTSANNSKPAILKYTYDLLGNLSIKNFGINRGETYKYNLQGSLISQASPQLAIRYNYDVEDSTFGNKARYDGNLSMVMSLFQPSADMPKTREDYVYDYDNMGQLVSGKFFKDETVSSNTYSEDVTYDYYGRISEIRRVGKIQNAPDTYSYTYVGNQLSQIKHRTYSGKESVYRYAYDANGNLSAEERKQLAYQYNCLNLLSCVIDMRGGLGPKAYYAWLADGTKYAVLPRGYQEISRVYKGSFTYTGSSCDEIESVIFNGGQFVVNSQYDLTPIFLISDHLGSTRLVVDSSGKVLSRNSYYPYGLIHSDVSSDQYFFKTLNRFQFNGKERQGFSFHADFGLIDYGARMYDPVLGLWTTQDPAYQFVNPYMFCGNNPVNYIDKDGQFAWFLPMIIGGVIGAVSGYGIGRTAGASGWDMAGYIFGGSLIGGLSGGAAIGASAIGGGAILAGAASGAVAGGGFAGLSSGWNADAVFGGMFFGGLSGLASGITGAAIGGRGGAIMAGVVGSGLNSAFSGGNLGDVAMASLLGGAFSYGVYEGTSYLSYRYIMGNDANLASGLGHLKMSYAEYMSMQADFQRSRFYQKEYGMMGMKDGEIYNAPKSVRRAYRVDIVSPPGRVPKYSAHTHHVPVEGKAIYMDAYGNKVPKYLSLQGHTSTLLHGPNDVSVIHSLVLAPNTTSLRWANSMNNIILNFPRFEYFPWFAF